MKKDALNALLRDYAKNHLSPTKQERDFVSGLYEAFKTAIGGTSILIGSYARFTAIRPMHDLDILFIAGQFDPKHLEPQKILHSLQTEIHAKFKNPSKYEYKVLLQTHSVTVAFLESGKEKFCVDIVPAFTSGLKNDFGDDIYWVPEILSYGPRSRPAKYQMLNESKKTELDWWLKSDPRGYIKAAADLNAVNEDFRKTSKLVKRWKHNCNVKFGEFKLKSFHIEQVIYGLCRNNPRLEIADALFQFFYKLPDVIKAPQIKDRADNNKFIDEYLRQLTKSEREQIVRARDAFLIKLENLSPGSSIAGLLDADERRRMDSAEAYLFDQNIPTYVDPALRFLIAGQVQKRNGFREFILDALGRIPVDHKIEFYISSDSTDAQIYKWKVKNDDSSPQPRGEITDHRTRNIPERTQYKGNHYIECYAIRDGVCIARSRQNVALAGIGKTVI